MASPAVGYPAELKNELPLAVPSSVKATQVKLLPSNTSVVGPATLAVATGLDAAQSWTGLSQNVIFDLPAGSGKGSFIDPRFTTISGRIKLTLAADMTTAAAKYGTCYLRSSASSLWDRAYIQSQSGVILEDINNYGLVADTVAQLECDVAQRDALASMYLFNAERSGVIGTTAGVSTYNALNSNQGISFPLLTDPTTAAKTFTAGSNYFSFCVPLISGLIGQKASKFFQIGATSRLQLVLQSSALIPITLIFNTATTQNVSITIDNLSLNLSYVDIGSEGVQMLNKSGLQYFSGTTYRVSSTTLPANTSAAGQVSLLSGIRGSSVRNIITRVSENSLALAGCCNGMYDSKLPPVNTIAYSINGQQYPPNPVDLVHAPATAFAFLMECNGNWSTYDFKSCIIPYKYNVVVAGGGGTSDADQNQSIAGTASEPASLASFMFGYSLEAIAKWGLFDGLNCNSGQAFVNMNFVQPNTNALTFYFIAKQDAIWVLDTATGEVSVRM